MKYVQLILCIFLFQMAEARKLEVANKGDSPGNVVAANCTPPTAATELNINNTRALIQNGGDMWWDFNKPRYEIPKGSGKNSIFAGSLWLAGQDVSGQFKVAAMRFRDGYDFWTGPLSTVNAEIDPATCSMYDRQWETTRSMVAEFSAWYESDPDLRNQLFPGYSIPRVIQEWPAHGRNFDPYNEDYYLAPFYDRNGDGNYDPNDGDYPGYVLSGKSDCTRSVKDIYGDQNIWWVFNDKGNVHTESGGASIGMEIRAQAFAFSTTDEVNNMTFYNYELINRSTFSLTETYFGQWVDGDLGNAQDDRVGCDVQRGLGFIYNGDDNDEDAGGALGYGANPPALGVDFFQGPFQANDGKDNCICSDYSSAIEDHGIVYKGQGAGYGDGYIDNERYGMRKFLFHLNNSQPTGDPTSATEYYNMLRGIWRDGTPMTYGGNAYNPANPNAIPTHYMFPGESDPLFWGTDGVNPGSSDWTDELNPPSDKRFLQSSGPFTLGPGAVNNITIGVVWAQAQAGGRLASIDAVRRADDKTQALFDACFEILDGPHAPDVVVQELDKEVILMLENPAYSNNYKEGFNQIDPFMAIPVLIDTNGDQIGDVAPTALERDAYATYKFEGYQIFQLKYGTVGVSDLENPDKARLVAEVDIKNDVTRLINYEYDPQLQQEIPVLKTEGNNEGIEHSFQITEDLFATEDNRLINFKTYYFMAVAYAINNFGGGYGNLKYLDPVYDPSDPQKRDGQKVPYLRSRTAANSPVRVYEAIPHATEIEENGLSLNSKYGDGVEITQYEGLGNSGYFTKIKQTSIDELFSGSVEKNALDSLVYEVNAGPVQVKVIDPLMVQAKDYSLEFYSESNDENNENWKWRLFASGIDTVYSDQTIEAKNEQCIPELGISINANLAYKAGSAKSDRNGFVGFEIEYNDPTDSWMTGVVDIDGNEDFNWIKSGEFSEPLPTEPLDKTWEKDDHFTNFQIEYKQGAQIQAMDTAHALDKNEDWENIAGRTWAPFALCSYDTAHPLPLFSRVGNGPYRTLSEQILEKNRLKYAPGVDVIITSDKSKWSRVPVFEAQDDPRLSQGKAARGELRRALSVDKNGLNQLDANCNLAEATYNGKQVLDSLVDYLRDQDKEYFTKLGVSDLSKLSFGMAWFPGYAIDVETGERLNMAFSEDSWLANDNGLDMIWNPTSSLVEPLFNEVRFGGKHMVYVFRNNREEPFYGYENMQPAYDGGQFNFERLVKWNPLDVTILLNDQSPIKKGYMGVMISAAWVGYPLISENKTIFGKSGDNDVTVRLRSNREFTYFNPGKALLNPTLTPGMSYYVKSGALITEQIVEGISVQTKFEKGEVFVSSSSGYTKLSDVVELAENTNNGLPKYHFSTKHLAPTRSKSIGEDALGDISVVPNPYYAYSSYESSRLDYEVKVINLPAKCTINIFTVNGTLVRTLKKDDANRTYLDWDLKNADGILISSGLYIFHVTAPELGEKTVKWFGALRPIDLNSF